MTTPYRADQVGSLLRPKPLIDARLAHDAGEVSDEALKAVEDQSILKVLELQRATGIQVFSDGEFRRTTWGDGFLERLKGLGDDPTKAVQGARWQGSTGELATKTLPAKKMVVDKVSVAEPFTTREVEFLKAQAGAAFKITLPSPTMFLRLFVPGASDRAYKDADELAEDFVAIYLDEVEWLLRMGVPYIQLDSLRYINIITDAQKADADKAEIARRLQRNIEIDNRILSKAKAPGVTRGMHICRGNHRSAWFGEGSYESVAEALFGQAEADRFLLEYDDERSGGFEPLRFVPKGKSVVLGLITSKSGKLESIDELRRRVDEAAKFIPMDSLAISPQCGFASTHLGNLLSEDEEMRKLELVAEAARVIWG